LPLLQLDAVRYPNDWTPISDDVLRERVTQVVADRDWIIEGNYAAVRDLIWGHAELVVWLDMPKHVVFRRSIQRTLRSLMGRQDAGLHRESWRRAFGKRSIIVWALRSHAPLRREYERSMKFYEGHGTLVVRLRSPGEVAEWLASLRFEPASDQPGVIVP
jgi:hypothetical protein